MSQGPGEVRGVKDQGEVFRSLFLRSDSFNEIY